MAKKKENKRLDVGDYIPKVQVSGSSVEYKTKKLFNEIFDEQDVKDFMELAEVSSIMEDEVIAGELLRKMNSMIKNGKQPLQCMVYATKNKEKVFYNNEKKVIIWAQAIASLVNSNIEYVSSINHMLVNWSIWKYQVTLLIKACGYIKQNDKLDEVIQELYINNEDDKIKFTVMKRMLHGCNVENYKSAFVMLRNLDFISNEIDRKYFNALKRKVENATSQEYEKLYSCFRSTQGLSGAKRRRIESIFIVAEQEPEIAKKINESAPNQKDAILKEVHNKIYGSQKNYRDIAAQAKYIKLYKKEIQDMFMHKLDKTTVSLEDIKTYGLAIGDLDSDDRAIPFLEEQMSMCMDDAKQIMFAYVLAIISDLYIDKFITGILEYSGNNYSFFNSVKNLNKQGKKQIVRQYLYTNCINIKNKYGIESSKLKKTLRNVGVFLQGSHTAIIYDVKFDQLLFEFLGYNKIDESIDKLKCTARNTTIVLDILENVMDKNNYEGRYMKFMWRLFAYLKSTNINIDLINRIDDLVKKLTGHGIPSTN